MAKLRVFVSSTFYDLKILRADIESLITQLGYDAVLNERGSIPFEKDKRLDQSCYREIQNCDIVVSIVGGRLGSPSSIDSQYSISQMEALKAVELGKQLFIFVDRSVAAEYATWSKNPGVEIKWAHADSPKIFEFLKFVYDLPQNNAIQVFDAAADITTYLKEQFAGLFQRLLSETQNTLEVNLASQLRATAQLLNESVEKVVAPTQDSLAGLAFANQPIFQSLRSLLNIPYRVFFTTRSELNEWLNSIRFKPVSKANWDSPDASEWYRDNEHADIDLLQVSMNVFEKGGSVKYIPSSEWSDDAVRLIRDYNTYLAGSIDVYESDDEDDGTGDEDYGSDYSGEVQ